MKTRKVALITGTSKGLGLELARLLTDSEYVVLGVSRSESPLTDPNYYHILADVTSEDFEKELSEFVLSLSISKIDLIVNNAGIASYGANLSSSYPNDLMSQFELHCVAPFKVVKAIQNYISGSTVVNVTSRLGSINQLARGDFLNRNYSYSYRIAKSAQNMLSACLANDKELEGVKVLSVIPGTLKTDSGLKSARNTPSEGASKLVELLKAAPPNGIYHIFDEEALY